jgi:hypothetical protein
MTTNQIEPANGFRWPQVGNPRREHGKPVVLLDFSWAGMPPGECAIEEAPDGTLRTTGANLDTTHFEVGGGHWKAAFDAIHAFVIRHDARIRELLA